VTDDETWKRVIADAPHYEVSDAGNVRSFARSNEPRAIALCVQANGYVSVNLSIHGKSRKFWVHRLVCAAFHGAPQRDMDACHVNGVRNDNRASNLRWGTRAQNVADTQRHGAAWWQAVDECKFGHALVHPNLTSWGVARGVRECRSCTHGRNKARSGRAVFRVEADAFYQALMAGSS